jgi:hypothetical protein
VHTSILIIHHSVTVQRPTRIITLYTSPRDNEFVKDVRLRYADTVARRIRCFRVCEMYSFPRRPVVTRSYGVLTPIGLIVLADAATVLSPLKQLTVLGKFS